MVQPAIVTKLAPSKEYRDFGIAIVLGERAILDEIISQIYPDKNRGLYTLTKTLGFIPDKNPGFPYS